MDTQAYYEGMLRSIARGDDDDARDQYHEIREYIRDDGPMPAFFEDVTVRTAFLRGFDAMRSVALAMNL